MERRYDVFLSYFTPPLQFAQRGSKSGKVTKNDYTYFYQTFLLPAAVQDAIIHYTFFPAVKYRAGYALECVFDDVKGKPEARKALKWQTQFDVYAPFEFGVDVSTEINPVLAVLSNIICRGLPTFSSPRIEDAFEHVFACSKPKEIYGGTIHESSLSEEDKGRIVDCIVNKKLSGDDKIDQLVYTPLAIARFQKILVEVIGSGRLDLNAATWYILVEEGDVPFARLALDDFREMYGHLVALAQDSLLKLPEISLTVVPSTRFSGSPFAEQRSAVSSPPDGFDLVVEYSSVPKTVGNDEFSRYKVKNGCYFKVSSCKATDTVTVRRLVYTSEQIIYKPFCVKEANGLYANIPDRVQHLRYFLNLLFRKNDFRPGQLPILNRALQDKSVIGLLPTGGGKSLTYQLAAMLQPGVTLVVDPLISLMSDQFEGLRRIKIDCCTYINSSVNDAAERESKMEASRYLFVFISPERLCILRFRNRLQNMRDLGVYFAYGVIDEVHCVSEWGHDFRYSYLHLGRNLYQYVRPKQKSGNEHIALFGLTATASFDVLADVERDLSGEGSFPLDGDAIVRYENTNRLELQYKVVNIGESPNPWSKWDTFRHVRDHVPTSIKVASKWLDELNDPQAQKLIKERFAERENITDAETIAEIMATGIDVSLPPDWMAAGRRAGSAIVFCPHRQGVLGVNNTGGNSGVREILAVNLGLPQNDVSAFVGGDVLDEQNRFLSGRTSLMVATKAFGMGIDKPDVRFTCHVNHSSSLEGFVQEAGRAGRDRKMALAMILYCPTKNPSTDQTYAYEVINFFFQDNFRGKEFEKKIMFHLMTKNVGRWFSAADGDEASVSPQTVHGFMERLAAAPIGSSFIYVISTSFDSTADANQWLIDKWNDIGDRDAAINELGKKYRDYVMKAIYRMCCLRVIDDYTENYADNTLRIVATHYPEGEYYASLKRFLLRYYTEERANAEVEKAKHMRGQNEVQRCLAFLTEFVYEKIAMKKRHAMRDMESFCQLAIQSKKNWLETNEDLKDYIYYYFNSKYAREGYQTDAGEPFSLKDDTDEGKFCSFDIVFKYIRVIDDDVTGADGSPKDNIKHLLGAVRLIRRALTDTNPALSLLNVFCLLFLRDETKASEVLQKELWKSYHDAYCDFREREGDVLKFLANMKRFVDEMVRRNVIGEDKVLELSQWQAEAECVFQERWLKDFSKKFTR